MKSKYLLLAILIISSFLSGCRQDRKITILENNSKKINKACPVRVDSLVVLDSTFYDKRKNTMTYFYTASGTLDDSTLINKNYASIKNSLSDAIDNSVDMRGYKEYNVTLVYQYNSSTNKKVLATFTIPTIENINK